MRTHSIALAVACTFLLGACSSSSSTPPATPLRAGFLWGTATAAHQIEGGPSDQGLHENDLYQWEQGGHIANHDSIDTGPDGYARWQDDLDLMQAMGVNAYRFSIEWSRVEPHDGVWDEQAIAHCGALIDALRARHIEPVVTLQHFTLPIWLHDLAAEAQRPGWAAPIGNAPVVDRAARFAGEMARRFGDRVDWWIPLNEPNTLWSGAYLGGQLPPGHVLDFAGVQRAHVNQIEAHVAMTDAIRANDQIDAGSGRATFIGIAQHMRVFMPKNPSSDADVRGADQLLRDFNDAIIDAVTFGDLDLNFDGQFDRPGEGQGLSRLAGRLDFVGINYYSTQLVLGISKTDDATGITLLGLPQENDDPAVPHTDVGWQIYPQGMHDLLVRAHLRWGLPIVVTENGIADADDSRRARFLVDHVKSMQDAVREGADVRGYLHWSLYDNFEWSSGYAPKFGLATVDRTDPLRKRTARPSAQVFKQIAQSNGVTAAIDASVPLR